MTSAYANKLFKQLDEEKAYWRTKESESYVYKATADEEPLVPEYQYINYDLDKVIRAGTLEYIIDIWIEMFVFFTCIQLPLIEILL